MIVAICTPFAALMVKGLQVDRETRSMIRDIVRKAWADSPAKMIGAIVATPFALVVAIAAYVVFVEAAHSIGIP